MIVEDNLKMYQVTLTKRVSASDIQLIRDIKSVMGDIVAMRVLRLWMPDLGLKEAKEIVDSL